MPAATDFCYGRYMRWRNSSLWAAVSIALASLAPAAQAALLASDSFIYSPGPLAGQNGGAGWSSAWLTGQSTVFTIQASSLTAGIGSAGGALFYDGSHAVSGTGARILRQLDLGAASAAAQAGVVEASQTRFGGIQPALGTPGTTVWFGVVINGGTAGNGLAGAQYLAQLHFYDGATTTGAGLALGDNNKDGEAIAIGRGAANTVWNFERTCAHDNCPGGSGSSTSYLSTVTFGSTTHWLVMRFDFASAATTNITTWLDPAAGNVIPTDISALTISTHQIVAVAGLHFNWVELGGQTSQFSFDELRFATTFAELSSNTTVAVLSTAGARETLRLAAGPSPFRDTSTLQFNLPFATRVDIRVIDVAGNVVRTLQGTHLAAGEHTLQWDGRNDRGGPVDAGVYLICLRSPAGERTVKVLRLL